MTEPAGSDRPATREWAFPRTRRYLGSFRQAGLTGALACYCLSLTPSLLPRVHECQYAMEQVHRRTRPGVARLAARFQGGKTVRFANSPADLASAQGWQRPRVVYLQNASDPIVWWSWQLAFHKPDWLNGQRAPDVSTSMRWYPLVTFWQVVGDLALSTAVPPGHGHSYGMLEGASAWASIIPPPGWTPERTAALARQLAG